MERGREVGPVQDSCQKLLRNLPHDPRAAWRVAAPARLWSTEYELEVEMNRIVGNCKAKLGAAEQPTKTNLGLVECLQVVDKRLRRTYDAGGKQQGG
jgi:hypothetical protein